MEQLLLLAAVICFGVAVLKFAGSRTRSAESKSAAPVKHREPWNTVPAQEAEALVAAEETVLAELIYS